MGARPGGAHAREHGWDLRTKGTTMDQVIAVSFEDDSKAYEALTKLKELDSQGQFKLDEAAVVIREEDGHVDIRDEIGAYPAGATVTGGLVGLLIGILGGPFGILIGGATGLFLGSLFDMHDSDDTESVLSDIAQSVRIGHATLLAEVHEQSPDVIDVAMAGLGGTVLRRSVDDVEAEIAAAEDAQKEARRAARKHLHEQRREQRKDAIRAKVDELKAKLHRRQSVGAAS